MLNQIRERKERQEAEKKRKEAEKSNSHQAEIREKATQRQIEALKAKIKSKSEL